MPIKCQPSAHVGTEPAFQNMCQPIDFLRILLFPQNLSLVTVNPTQILLENAGCYFIY